MTKIEIYTGNKCGFCDRAKDLFRSKNLFFEEYNINLNPNYLKEMQIKTNGKKTIPQIFINDRYIGGFDNLKKLIDDNEFESFINI